MEEKKNEKVEEVVADGVVNGKINTRKKSTGHKILETFLEDDISDVKDYVVTNVVVPGVKDFIRTVAVSFIESMFGNSKRSGNNPARRYGYGSSPINYNKISNNINPPAQQNNSYYDSYDIELYEYDDREDAERVIDKLTEYINRYGEATVSNYYQAHRLERRNWTDNDWGWRDLSNARTRYTSRGKWVIDFPRVKYLK